MTPLAVPTLPKFSGVHSSSSRAMLARDADAMYWMSRYVERSEHVARLLLVNTNLLMDVGELAPTLQQKQWQSVLTIFRQTGLPDNSTPTRSLVCEYMTFNPENPNSLMTCLTRARENARGIRENISAEMWESLNTLFWAIKGDEARARFEESPDDFYRSIMIASMLFQGLTDQTLPHDQGWEFAQLGKYLERADITSRIVETKFSILRSADQMLAGAMRNIHWMAVLRACCSIENFRRQHVGDMDPFSVVSFLILEENFPRSVRYCISCGHDAISAIRREVNPSAIDPAERILGRLSTQLQYSEIGEIMAEGLPAYLARIQALIAESVLAIQKTYFLY